MKLADQTNKTCRLNVGQDLGDAYFISMVITKRKLIANDKVVKYQKVEKSV